jgi:hypothetical protein
MMDSIYQPIRYADSCLGEDSIRKKGKVIRQLNLDMFRPDYKPKIDEDRIWKRLQEKYRKLREDQVLDSIK